MKNYFFKIFSYLTELSLIFFAYFIIILNYKSIITTMLLVYLFYLIQYFLLLFKVFFLNKKCVINAPAFSHKNDWQALFINFLLIKPQSNIFLSIYASIYKIKNNSTARSFIKLKYIYILFWIIFSSFLGYSYFLIKAVFAGLKSIFSKNPTITLFNNLNWIIKSYDISNMRIICDNKIWLNPNDKFKQLIKIFTNCKDLLLDAHFKDAAAYAREHGIMYKIHEEYILTLTSRNLLKAHTFLIGQTTNNNEIILSKTHDYRTTFISTKIDNTQHQFSQVQFQENYKNFLKIETKPTINPEIAQQIYSAAGIKLFYNPVNNGIINIMNKPSIIAKIDNSFIQKDVNLVKMASTIESLQQKYNIPIKIIEALINEIVLNNIKEEAIEQIAINYSNFPTE